MPLKRCANCLQWKSPEAFSLAKRNPDGRYCYCRSCDSLRRHFPGLASTSVDRDSITSPDLLDTCDRGERRQELAEIGVAGVRELRRRVAAARKAKAILCGAFIPEGAVERLMAR